MEEITRLLTAAAEGDRVAARELFPLVYEELRRMAAARLAVERPGQTLQPTALVNEVYLRLAGAAKDVPEPTFANRRHFFAAAAESMRRILIDQARKKKTEKHGGGRQRVDLEVFDPAAPESVPDLEALGIALEVLKQEDPEAAELVNLRWFAGLAMPQVAEVLGLSLRTAERQWAYARAWLFDRIQKTDDSRL